MTTICEGLRADILRSRHRSDRVTVIPNAVDPRRISRSSARRDDYCAEQLGLSKMASCSDSSDRSTATKGSTYLLEALPRILQFEPRTRVLLVGGGVEEERLKAQAVRLGIADKVMFTGRVPHREVNRYYSLVDLLVFPRKSMRLTETVTPLKPLEAMAQGCLLIASDVGGHRELIEDGVTGDLFRPDDPAALADAVRIVLGDRSRWNEIRAAGRRFVEQQRNWRASVGRYAAVYEAALGAAGGR